MTVTEPHRDLDVSRDHDRHVSSTATGSTCVTAAHDSDSLIWGADLIGLGMALTRTLQSPALLAVADGTLEMTGEVSPVRFPDPVGTRDAQPTAAIDANLRLLLANGVDEWSAIRVTGERTLAMVDDGRFASAVALAAAALLPPGPVWEHHEAFLSEAKRLGLRFAQAVAG